MNLQALQQLPLLSFEVEDPEPILSDRAYAHTQRTVNGLQRSLEEYRLRGGAGLSPTQCQLVIDGLQALIEEWSQQMRDYKQLKDSGFVPQAADDPAE